MTSIAVRVPPVDDSSTLLKHLQRQLDTHFGAPRAIAAVTRRPCVYTSSFRIEELGVRFEDGSRLPVILKDFSLDTMVADARRVRPRFLYRPNREIGSYRWLLPHAPVGAPAFYGAVADEAAERHWLFLEYVSGLQLAKVGRFSDWARTAAWVAKLHHGLSPLQVASIVRRTGAMVCDEEFYWRWMRRAQGFAAHDRVRRRAVDDIARRYRPIVAHLAHMPRTIIHGEFYASNVIVHGRGGSRICPLDWEMASFGPGLIDLAALSAGWAESKQVALARAYLRAAAEMRGDDPAAPVRLTREFRRDLNCCRLFLAVRMLGWSGAWVPPRVHARDWAAEAARILDRLQG